MQAKYVRGCRGRNIMVVESVLITTKVMRTNPSHWEV